MLTHRIESEPRQFIQVLYGPRQVGKTTLALQFMESTNLPVHFASADLASTGQSGWISQQWEAARIKFRQSEKNDAVLIIDEIRKIENWSEAVKKEWDSDTAQQKSLKVILPGSSRLLLQQGLTESLAGRFESIYIGHWSYREMKEAFDYTPDQHVWFG
ncbi:AAA family ATPase, partial [Chlorobium limicola]